MKANTALLILFSAAPAFAAEQCGKGQMPSPSGCIQVCEPGYAIGKENGFDTCLREGNFKINVQQSKYAFLSIAASKDVDGVCFGIRKDEGPLDSVVDDRFVEREWHAPNSHVWVAEISYTLDATLTKLHLTALRYYRIDQNRKPIGVSDRIPENAEVPLYDAPQPQWPCTKQQWVSIMTPPQISAVPPGYRAPDITRSPSGRCWYFQREVWGPYGFKTCQ